MFGNNLWIWLKVGLMPYYINKQPTRNGWMLQIRALFWSLEVHIQQYGKYQFVFCVPLIQRLQKAVWTIILQLRGDDPPQG